MLNGAVEIRLLGEEDSISELTQLLHRAYRPLADAGMRYVASWQDDDITRKRVARGECYLAFAGDRLAGTILFTDAAGTDGCPWYDRPDVASFHQFAVEPELQRFGIGAKLVEVCERRAADTGAGELGVDTSEHATHLIDWYGRLGYRIVGDADWSATNYRSVVLSKRVSADV